MRILLPLILALLSLPLNGVESQFSTHFQRRFGLDSFIYNEPLYFSSKRLITKERTPKTRNYRNKIKKNIEKSRRKRKSHQKDL